MMVLGRLQGSLLVVCAIALSVFFFAGGFAVAVYLGGLDTSAATAVAGTVLNRSEYLARNRRALTANVSRMARRPMFALSSFAARPVQGFYKKIPGSLRPLSPQNALNETLRLRRAELDTAVGSGTQSLSGAVQSATTVRTAAPGGTPPAGPAAAANAGAAPRDASDAAQDDSPEAAEAAAAGAPPPAAAASPAASPAAAASPATQAASAPGAPAAAPAPEVPRRVLPAPAPATGGLFAIELASFRQVDSANAFVAEMQRRKLAVSVVGETDVSGREWQHVRLGPYPTEEQAANRLIELRQVQGLPGIIVQEPMAERQS